MTKEMSLSSHGGRRSSLRIAWTSLDRLRSKSRGGRLSRSLWTTLLQMATPFLARSGRLKEPGESGTVEVGSRTLTEHPRAKLYHRSPSPSAGRQVKWSSPLDSTQQAALEQKRAEGLVVTSYPSKNPGGDVVYTISTTDPSAVRDALDLRSDQQVLIELSPWTAATVEATRAALIDHGDEWHSYSIGTGRGVAGGPVVLTYSVAWLEPDLLEVYEATPPGLLELDVWLSPAEER